MLKFKNILAIILGAGIFSFGIEYLVIPFHLYEGGATGLTLVVYYLFKIPVSITNLMINIPLFIIAWKILGSKTLYLSILGTFSVSAWLILFELLPFTKELQNYLFTALDKDVLIACLGTGIILGTGLGIIFNAGGTTGGTDIVARIFNKYTSISMGKLMLTVDFIVIVIVLIVFRDLRMVSYTLIFVFITSRVIDLIAEGGFAGKGFLIVTSKPTELAEAINHQLERGITYLNGQGFYSKQDLNIVYCVVSRNEMQQMKKLINKVDPFAFTTITEAHEILGEGFTLDANKQPIVR
ncbi:MAG: YitT family protein [Streptococcus sp.]|nr:YitT family protein [Streptococcus sp.]